MEVIILKKFDTRKVGTTIDLEGSTAEILIKKGIVGIEIEKKEVNQKNVKKNEKNY